MTTKMVIQVVNLVQRRSDAGSFRRLIAFVAIRKSVFWLAEYDKGLRLIYLTSRENADLKGLQYVEGILIRQALLWR